MKESHAIISNGQAKPYDYPNLEKLLAALDHHLRHRQGVFEYSQSPDCLFRIELIASAFEVTLRDGSRVRCGDRLVNLHIWSEQFPIFPAAGPTVAWAQRVGLRFGKSLRELDRYLTARRDLDDVAGVCANMALCGPARAAQLARIVGHFGFERVAAAPPSLQERVHRLGENILIAMMVLARNARALRGDALWRDRTLVFLSRATLHRCFGRGAPERGGPSGCGSDPLGSNHSGIDCRALSGH